MNISISDVINQAWQHTKKHGITLAIIYFAASVISFGIQSIGLPTGYLPALFTVNFNELVALSAAGAADDFNIWSLVGAIVSYIIAIAMSAAALRVARTTGKSLSAADFSLPFSTFTKVFAYYVIICGISAIGFLLCIVPGLYLLSRLLFGAYYLMEHPEASIMDALRFSWNATKHCAWSIIGLEIVAILISYVGILLCCVGMYYTMIIALFANVVVYLKLSGNNTSDTSDTYYQTAL